MEKWYQRKTGDDRFPLEQWFDTTKKIDRSAVDLCLAQMALYRLKDGEEPYGAEWQAMVNALEKEVRLHNSPFIEAQQRQEKIARLSKKIAILKGQLPAKSASQRRFLEVAVREGVPATLDRLMRDLDALENPPKAASGLSM